MNTDFDRDSRWLWLLSGFGELLITASAAMAALLARLLTEIPFNFLPHTLVGITKLIQRVQPPERRLILFVRRAMAQYRFVGF